MGGATPKKNKKNLESFLETLIPQKLYFRGKAGYCTLAVHSLDSACKSNVFSFTLMTVDIAVSH